MHVDLDPGTIWEVQKSEYKNLYHHSNLIAGKEDAAGNFARGYYEIGPEVIDYVMDRIRLTAENCDGL